MAERGIQAIGVIPALVESRKDVRELLLAETVEVCDDRVQFVNHVFLLVRIDRSVVYINSFGPLLEPLVRAGEPPREFDGSPPSGIASIWPWYGQRTEEMEIHMNFDETTRIPVKWNRAQDTEQK